MLLLAEQLKTTHQTVRKSLPDALNLRLHRAISWLQKAEQCDDDDTRFITLWIAFNAAYSQELGLMQLSDSSKYRQFLDKIVSLDEQSSIQSQLWENFTQAIRVLLDNKYVYQPFWNHHNGIEGYDDWQERFNKSKQAAQISILNQDTAKVLNIIFERLYTLRNQIIHGGATWNSQTNRQQLKDATNILGQLVPIIINIMMNHPEQIWGEACYPVVE